MTDTIEQERIAHEIMDLRAICPTFEDYITNQVYLSKYGPDPYTDTDILRDGYEIIHGELEDLGIYFDGDLFEDGYQRHYFYHFRKFFDGETFKELLRVHPDWKETIRVILDSDENMNDTLNELLEYLYNVYSYNYDVRQLYDKWLECTSNELFDAHIRAILDDAPEAVSVITDPEAATAYVSFINKGRQDASTAARMIFDSLVAREYSERVRTQMMGLTWEDISPYLDRYDLDKVSADEISYYAVFDADFNKEVLPECIKAKAKIYMDTHHKRSHHHVEYWEEKNKQSYNSELCHLPQIPAAALVVLVAHHYHIGMNAADMLKAVKEAADDKILIHVDDKSTMYELCNAFCE